MQRAQLLQQGGAAGCGLGFGASGFLPSYIVETLLRLNEKQNKNIKIIALVRDKEKALKKFEHHKNRKDLEFLVQDVCDPINVKPEENNAVAHNMQNRHGQCGISQT